MIYLFQRHSDGEGKREREAESSPSAGALIKVTPQPGMVQAKARTLDVCSVSCRGLCIWAIFCCFPRLITRELDKNGAVKTQMTLTWDASITDCDLIMGKDPINKSLIKKDICYR